MNIHFHLHHHFDDLDKLKRLLKSLQTLGEKIMASQAELQAKLTSINEKLDEASTEIVAQITELKDALAAAGHTTPETDAILDQLTAKAEALANVSNPPIV